MFCSVCRGLPSWMYTWEDRLEPGSSVCDHTLMLRMLKYVCAAVGVLLRAVIKCGAVLYILVCVKSRKTER